MPSADGPPQVRTPTPVSTDSESDTAYPAQRAFKWAPTYGGLWNDVDLPGSDAWSIKRGHPSITALKANFAHAEHEGGCFSHCKGGRMSKRQSMRLHPPSVLKATVPLTQPKSLYMDTWLGYHIS
ncbi:hypothetical protein CC80DRAFT_594369 [Byssothecium circinans]|uniref:Uncharacterized protein n=1 Tax=Byssothecium circinans TaxID=147558 RepID=A0A6A5TR99_9PLEO|nr:hypothetical protein CC80DRAFT_594369 [Byssothecium circinans]